MNSRLILKQIKAIILIGFCFFIVACSKVTRSNFDQIQPGMSMKQVVALIGEPTHTESINVAGLSGTSAVWKDSKGEIDIQFFNDKVAVKAFSKTGDKAPSAND